MWLLKARVMVKKETQLIKTLKQLSKRQKQEQLSKKKHSKSRRKKMNYDDYDQLLTIAHRNSTDRETVYTGLSIGQKESDTDVSNVNVNELS